MLKELNGFIEDSVEMLEGMKNDLENERQYLNEFLKVNIISKLSTNKIILQDRVKSSESLSEKIIRKNYYEKYKGKHKHFISRLPDLIGIRIVCFLNDDEELVVNDLNKLFKEDSSNFKGYKCIENGKESNLYIELKDKPDIQKNQNPIYKYACIWSRNGENFNVEIQVKSLIHMFWGELEHMLIYKNYNYLVDSNFYSEIMDSTYHLLKNVDNQLKVIQNHLHANDKSKEIKEVKEMIAKILHKNIQKKIEECLNCKIDLRELYDSLVSLLFHSAKETSQIFEKANLYLIRAAQFKLTEEQLQLDNILIEGKIRGQADGIKELAKVLDGLMKDNDIYWRLLYVTYSYLDIQSENDYTEKIKSIANIMLEIFRGSYIEDITIDEDASDYLNSAIVSSIINSLNNSRKIDFINKKDNILSIISEFIQDYQESIEELTPEERNQDVLENIICFLSSKIILTIDGKISREYLKPIVDNYMNNKIRWQPNIIEKEKLEKFIKGENLPTNVILKILQGEKIEEASYEEASNRI